MIPVLVAALLASSAFTPISMFAGGVPGLHLDARIDDLSSLYQDSAGTIPVTAVEQPVGRVVSAVNGVVFHQPASTSRPTLSARYNLLTKTEQFNDEVWVKSGATVTENTTTAPDGTTTADTISSTAGFMHFPYQDVVVSVGTTLKYSFYILKTTSTTNGLYGGFSVEFRTASTALAEYGANINSDTGSLIAPSGWGTAGFSTSLIVDAGNYWFITVTTPAAPATTTLARIFHGVSGYFLNGTRVNSGSSSKVLWGADLRVANDGVNLPAYQRVNTATDYDTANFPLYLYFDGIDDFLVSTATVDLRSTDKVGVFATVRKLSDAAGNVFMEFTAGATAANGSFLLSARAVVATDLFFYSRGTIGASVAPAGYPSPQTLALVGLGDISGDTSTLIVNGVQAAQSTGDQGAGNYSNSIMYIGRRGGTSLPSKMRLYFPLTVVGKMPTATEIANNNVLHNVRNRIYA
jgi:hypothetical protein